MIIFDKLKKTYSTFAILLLNTIFCILILNGLCSLGLKISKLFSKDPVMDRYDPSTAYDSYPDMNHQPKTKCIMRVLVVPIF